MKIFFFSNKFPVEDISNLFCHLRLQSQYPKHAILCRLLEETTTAIRDEIRLLPPSIRAQIPPFQSILDLAQDYNWQRSILSGTFECVFLCLTSLCVFVGDYEARPHEFRFTKDNAVFTGLGLGFLAATAIAASPSLLDVPATAADVIRIAMRAGLVVYQRSQEIEPQDLDAPLQSWTTLVKGLGEETVQREVDRFNSSTETPRPSQVYISVVEPDGSVFVSGPPSKLRQLFDTPGTLQSAPRAPLPVYGGPCHARHLYDCSHVSWVMRHVRPEIGNRQCSNAARLLSMADGGSLDSRTALELFESATYILLTGIIRWDNVVSSIGEASWWQGQEGIDIQVGSCCKHSAVVEGLVRELQSDHSSCTTSIRSLTQWISDRNHTGAGNDSDGKIAVVGMSCRLPGGAEDLERFWELLEEGRDAHGKVPADRYDVESHTDSTGRRPNTSQTPFGCFIDNPGLFDAAFFDMSPREAAQTDPTHRLALLTAYEALEQSGYVPNRTLSTTRETVATIYGQCSDDYREANAGQDIDMYFIPGNYRAFAPGRISYFFKFSGPSFSVDTACSASLAAVQIACTTLSRGEADMAVAGGLNILTSSDSFAGLSRAYFLSKTGGCKVFDDGADGYCRADGVGSLILKRLSDAERDNDNILGVILAARTNHSSAAVSITNPHAPTQEALYRSVLRQAGVSPLDVDLVEMHGTGTQAGDAAEMESVTRVFSPSSTSRRKETLHIGSVKANLGHSEAAAGITALIKALLVLQHNAIPKHIGIQSWLNTSFPDLSRLNVHIPRETIPWPARPHRKRYIMVNNFSAAGGNTSLLLEEPPQRSSPSPEGSPYSRVVVAVSAKNAQSLLRNLEQLIAYLQDRSSSVHLASLAYTTTARRIAYHRRVAVHGASVSEILSNLQLRLQEMKEPVQQRAPLVEPSKPPPPIAFVFSGQGSFYIGIGRELLDHYPPYRREIHRLDQICALHGFPSILPALASGTHHHAPHPTTPDSVAKEISPLIAQLTTVCVQIALFRLWTSLGVTPQVVIGASLGEYAALHAAGALSASDTIYLVGQRALLMQELCTANTHAMLAVQATVEEIAQCVSSSEYEISCINGTRSITVSGPATKITAVKTALDSNGYRSVFLKVPYAFHSSHVDPILERFDEIARTIPMANLRVPVISPRFADILRDSREFTPSYLRGATREPVKFSEALEKAYAAGLVTSQTVWVELGVHQTYSSAVRAVIPSTRTIVPSLRSDENNWSTWARSMALLHEAGVQINWDEWYKPFESELRLLDLPAYQWNLKKHWIQHNGDWLLVKDKGSLPQSGKGCVGLSAPPSLRSPLLHQVVEETLWVDGGRVVLQSDVHDEDFFAVASGHKMSGRPVVSVFSYPDMALSVAKYLYTKIRPNTTLPTMDFGNVKVIQGLVPQKNRSKPQHVRLEISVADLKQHNTNMQVSLCRVDDAGSHITDLAAGTVSFGEPEAWKDEWASMAHLVGSRVEALHQLANEGQADRLTRDMVYLLFKNIVDYSAPYRGIRSVVVHGLEAVADVILAPSPEGRWKSAPPHHIDSIAHVGGFILNAGHATDHANTMYVMEGWKSMRFAKPLVPGLLYRSYVRMVPRDTQGQGLFVGDVYVLDGDEIVGQLGGMSLRPLPRILMNRFFDPDDHTPGTNASASASASPSVPAKLHNTTPTTTTVTTSMTATSTATPSESPTTSTSSIGLPAPTDVEPTPVPGSKSGSGSTSKVIALICSETGVDVQDLTDATHLSEIGVDSLLSLVLAEKFAMELDIHLPGSFFLESPTVGEIKTQLGS